MMTRPATAPSKGHGIPARRRAANAPTSARPQTNGDSRWLSARASPAPWHGFAYKETLGCGQRRPAARELPRERDLSLLKTG
eukprot:366058-Chlamydomonas_euryale.AAC.14